jgi:hypothetical protein
MLCDYTAAAAQVGNKEKYHSGAKQHNNLTLVSLNISDNI